MPHNTSPLDLLSHRFLAFECRATTGPMTGGALALKTNYTAADFPDDPLRKQMTLSVDYTPEDPANPSTYEGTITILGEFRIHETFDEQNREALIRVTATSILYGACREMIANFTARSLHGILSLPSISFRKPKTET